MKKKYEKPVMFMESFEVAEFIAGCAASGAWYGFNSSSINTCWYAFENDNDKAMKFFSTDNGGPCKFNPPGNQFPITCYSTLVGTVQGFYS